MKGIQILTDKNHTKEQYEIFHGNKVSRAYTLNIGTEANTDFLGFGVAITGSSCYNLNLMEKSERTEFLKSIYSKEGLGLNVGRISIGSSDYSAEVYSYDDVPFDTELKHFSIERDKNYIIPIIKEILEINPDLYLFASPWSPPGWMKTGENMCGGYMREEYVECYVEYIIKFIKAYAECGIKISAITPQNEPETQQMGMMPTCIWHPEIEAKFIKALKKRLREENLDVKAWILDHSFSYVNRVIWMLDSDKETAAACDGIAFHYYDGTVEETLKFKRAYPEKDLHFTEGGPRLLDNYGTDWCKWGLMAAKALGCGYKSFTGWNLMLNETGGPNIGPFWCGGLVTRNRMTGELSYSGQYKAFCHFTKYIDRNSKIYPVYTGEEYNLEMFQYPKVNREVEGICIDNGDGKTVLVLVNPNTEKRQTQMYLYDKWWYMELMPESVMTFIIG